MSRTEETKNKIETILRVFKKLNEEEIEEPDIVASATEAAKVEILEDIAVSLASIADTLAEMNMRQVINGH